MRGQRFFHPAGLKKAILAGTTFVILVTPTAINVLAASSARTQPLQAATDTPKKIAERRAEQSQPRTAIAFDPSSFDKYAGYYELSPAAIFTIHRDGSRYLTGFAGQPDSEIFPESESKFFSKVVSAQISFNADAAGTVAGFILHQNGLEQFARRIDEATAQKLEADLRTRIKNNIPSPGTEAALRSTLQSLQDGKPDLTGMSPDLPATARSLGPMRSITFRAVGPGGSDIYEVQYAHGAMEWRINPLNNDGKIAGISGRRVHDLKHPIDIGGGRHLNMICMGKGSPTVVFLQGSGGNMTDWRKVWGPVASFTRECFYDRANLGYSDPSDKPTTAETVADDLHALLHTAAAKRPVVLVGHSLGGLYATYYADRFLPDVAGLVLVDPSFAGQFDLAVSQQDNAVMAAEGDRWAASTRACQKLAQDGKLSDSDRHNCNMPSRQDLAGQGLTPQEVEYVDAQISHPTYYANQLSEYENMAPKGGRAPFAIAVDGDQEQRHARPFGNLPTEVLTAAETFHNPNVSEATNTAIEENWKSGHDKLAARSTRGESIVIPNSHHFIQLDQPDRVVEAIRKVVMEARQ